MNYAAIIATAAKKVGVSATLLFAICSHESANFTDIYVHQDGGSPSLGICMIKEGTATQLGYSVKKEDLIKKHELNAEIAAKYLKYQMDRYQTQDWVVLAAAYNAGSYNPSKSLPGCPCNMRYIKRVQNMLSDDLKSKLECGGKKTSEGN